MKIDMSIKETGIKEAQLRIEYFRANYPSKVATALKKEAELTMTESKREVPVDTGSLRNSGFVEAPKISLNNISVKMGYGGVATKVNPKTGQLTTVYAITVHEDMETRHRVGKAKFLEDPIKKRRGMILENINLSIKRALEGSGIK